MELCKNQGKMSKLNVGSMLVRWGFTEIWWFWWSHCDYVRLACVVNTEIWKGFHWVDLTLLWIYRWIDTLTQVKATHRQRHGFFHLAARNSTPTWLMEEVSGHFPITPQHPGSTKAGNMLPITSSTNQCQSLPPVKFQTCSTWSRWCRVVWSFFTEIASNFYRSYRYSAEIATFYQHNCTGIKPRLHISNCCVKVI